MRYSTMAYPTPGGHNASNAPDMASLIGTDCTRGCRRPTPAQAHCSVCHRTFGGHWGFDKHRTEGRCLDPSHIGMVERDRVWRTPMEEGVREQMEKAREQRGQSHDASVR